MYSKKKKYNATDDEFSTKTEIKSMVIGLAVGTLLFFGAMKFLLKTTK